MLESGNTVEQMWLRETGVRKCLISPGITKLSYSCCSQMLFPEQLSRRPHPTGAREQGREEGRQETWPSLYFAWKIVSHPSTFQRGQGKAPGSPMTILNYPMFIERRENFPKHANGDNAEESSLSSHPALSAPNRTARTVSAVFTLSAPFITSRRKSPLAISMSYFIT